jgi:hypothetical protein
MLTNKITGFSADLLNTVRGILGEAKKCSEGCECEKCEAEEMKEGSMPTADEPTDANKKTADKVRAMMAKEKKPMKEEILEMVEEASSGLADKAKKSGVSLSTLKKVYARGIAAWNSGHRPGTTPQQWAHARVNSYITKGKGTYHGADKDLRSEGADMPFEGPYKKVGDRKDEYGNKVKNVAKYLAKKAMDKQKNEDIDPDLEAELKATRVTKKSIADSQKTRERASRMKEDLEHTNCGTPECCGECDTPEQIDEISADMADRYLKGKRERDWKRSDDDDYSVPRRPQDTRRKNIDARGTSLALKTIYRPRNRVATEEVEELDEVSKATMGRYINKAKDSIDSASYRQGHKEAHGSSSKALEKKLTKRHKGISTAVSKLTKEEQDFVDSLNNEIFEKADPYDIAGMIKKAKAKNDPNHPAMKHVAAIEDIKKHGGALSVQGDHVRSLIKALGEESMDNDMPKGLEDRAPRGRARNAMGRAIAKKERNLARARKEIASRNEEVENIDEISKDAALKYLSANKKDDAKARETGDYDRMTKRMRGTDMAVRKYTAKPGSKYVRVPATEEVEIAEARGRPRKAGAKDFTIHPKTKEKLMHNNPADMKRIERLQKNGVLEKPKVEAGQHIMNQLQKAKTSMLGGSKINFTHGDSKEVSGPHAAKILTKYAGMKPNEKEDFQKFVGHSHENLMKHV